MWVHNLDTGAGVDAGVEWCNLEGVELGLEHVY